MTICGWCEDTIDAGAGAAVAAPASHGICKSCLDEKLAALPARSARIARTGGSRPAYGLGRIAPAPAAIAPA